MTAVDFESFVRDLARLSGEAILPFFRTAIGVENKGRAREFNPVTEADRAAVANGDGKALDDIDPGRQVVRRGDAGGSTGHHQVMRVQA